MRRTHGGDTLIRRFSAHITQKTQNLLLRIWLSSHMDQPYHRFVKRWQAFKFELRPNGTQRRQMRCFAGSCRFVYNKGLAVQKARFEAGETKLTYAGLCKLLTQWRGETQTSWLKEAPAHPLQQALKDLERAYTNFFAKTGRRSAFQEKRTARSLSLSCPEADQARPDEFAPVPAQARLAALPQQPYGVRCGKERHCRPLGWQVVREHPDGERG